MENVFNIYTDGACNNLAKTHLGGWVTIDYRSVDIFHVTHWAYITQPNN